jgi:hypothetical protein
VSNEGITTNKSPAIESSSEGAINDKTASSKVNKPRKSDKRNEKEARKGKDGKDKGFCLFF